MSAKVVPLHRVESRFTKAGPNLFLNNETGFYYVRKSFTRYRIPILNASTQEKKVSRARAKADQMISDHMQKYLGDTATAMQRRFGTPISEVIAEILVTKTPIHRLNTQGQHRRFLAELGKEWGQWDVGRITPTAWATWLIEFKTRKPKRKTFQDYAKYMNIILRYAYERKLASHLVTVSAKDPKRRAGRVYTKDEIKALWNTMHDETRDQFALCFECFMRLREMLYLTWDRIDLKTGILTLRAEDVKTGSKTGKGRSFMVSKRALARLRARKERAGTSPYVFPSPTDSGRPMHQNKTAWIEAKKRAGITGRARWHDLRHTALTTALLESKMEPILVSEYAGVSLKTIQQVYLHSTAEKTASVSQSVKIFNDDEFGDFSVT